MRIFKKAIGGFLMGVGAIIILMSLISPSESKGATVILIIFGLLFIVPGLLLFRKKATIKALDNQIKEQTESIVHTTPKQKDPAYNTYYFNVAGISYREQDIFDKIMIENYEYEKSKKELLEDGYEDGDIIYKYDIADEEALLVPEPTNEYDPNAIKVMIGDIHVGYVPKDETIEVSEILKKEVIEVICRFTYGPYKIIEDDYDDMTDTVKTNVRTVNNNVSGRVTIKYN